MSKVLIVANGEWPRQFDVETVGTYRVVVALDGAANRLIGSKMIPDILLGDLDSVSESVLEQCKASGVTIVHTPTNRAVISPKDWNGFRERIQIRKLTSSALKLDAMTITLPLTQPCLNAKVMLQFFSMVGKLDEFLKLQATSKRSQIRSSV